jgi:hypothetical protein
MTPAHLRGGFFALKDVDIPGKMNEKCGRRPHIGRLRGAVLLYKIKKEENGRKNRENDLWKRNRQHAWILPDGRERLFPWFPER